MKGILEFYSLFNPIKVTNHEGVNNLHNTLFDFFSSINGKKATMKNTMNGIKIKIDEKSKRIIEYENDDNGLLIVLKEADGSFGFSNISAYLTDCLLRLNSRNIIVTVTKKSIEISEDPDETVFGVYYTHNNSCGLTKEEAYANCKPGMSSNCCIFCTMSGNGFECQKFNSSTASYLLERLYNGESNAKRIGNCKILGRNEK